MQGAKEALGRRKGICDGEEKTEEEGEMIGTKHTVNREEKEGESDIGQEKR
jgi:hypothetical protein